MAEQVQSILERMVPYLKDLRQRSIFTPTEITSIVERRRKSEYLLHRRSSSNISDYIRYIEDEILLEKLRKLRKEKMIVELKNERQNRLLRNEEEGDDEQHSHKTAAYKTSGPGDSHIISHIHFLYQRTLRKFHYPIDILLNYVEFAKSVKSFQMLGRIYAEGIQHHPRTVGLWIEASNFEYFGYIAQDNDNQKTNGGAQGGEDGITTKIVGSSISNARVLMQRGLRINSTSEELWLQYFTLELHYVQKLRGRKEILELGKLLNDDDDDSKEIEMDVGDDDNDNNGEDGEDNADDNNNKEEEEAIQWEKNAFSLIPSQVIYKNAIKAIPTNVQFRLKFVETCRQFPLTQLLESYIMESVTKDFGTSVEGWVARISYAEEMMMMDNNKSGGEGVGGGGVLGMDNEDDSDVDDNGGKRPTKKARVEELVEANTSSSDGNDPALDLLQEALDAVPTSKMYVEGARFLRMRIQHLLNHHGEENSEDNDNEGEEEEEDYDVSHLIGKDEDANAAAQRHIQLLEKLYEDATKKDISSTALTLDHVDYLLSVDPQQRQLHNNDAEMILSKAVTTDADVRLWLRWAEVSTQVIQDGKEPLASPIQILRRALDNTPLHDRHAYTLILTELMQHLMAKPSTYKTNDELKSLFQKLVLLSQGSDYSLPKVKKGDGEDDDEDAEDETANVAASFIAYLKYSMLNDTDENENEVRSIYTSILYHSNYGKSCSGKTEDELLTMKSFFDTCIQYEKETTMKKLISTTNKDRKTRKKAKKMRLCKLYEAGIAFYESCGSGNSVWRNVVDGYTRDLNDIKYNF